MSKIKKSYIRGYYIPKYHEKSNSFENTQLISNPTQILTSYLDLLKETYNSLFKGKIEDGKDLKKFNDLFVLLTYGSLSIPWQEMVKDWLKKEFPEDKASDFIENKFESFIIKTGEIYDKIPTDYRPGLNISSLLIHSISTSALATCIFIKDQNLKDFYTLEFQLIRTISFFHNIGKSLSKRDPIGKTIELFNQYFKTIFSDGIFNKIVEEIKDFDKKTPSRIIKYVRWGDALSSSLDASKKICIDVLSDEISDIEKDFDNYDFWEKNGNQIEHWTKKFLDKYEEILKIPLDIDIEPYETKEIALIRGDIRRIHEYVDQVDKLSELRNSSILLDNILSIQLVEKLIENQIFGISPENIIYSSGGNILLFSPSIKAKKISEFLEEYFYDITIEGVVMTTEYITFDRSYEGFFGDLHSKLAIKIGAKKNNLMEKRKTPILFGSAHICDSCGKKVATKHSKIDKEKKYCDSCWNKYELPNNEDIKIQKRWDNELRKEFQDLLGKWYWKDISDYILEFCSGVSLKDIKEKKKNQDKKFPSFKLAVINSDGNLIGEFISKSTSLSDLYSRIFYISNTMIRIFENLENRLKNKNKKEDAIRLKIGRLYVGGDDILILVPAYLAIPISLTLTKEFYKAMGSVVTLSTGIFSCSSKFPIWIAIETARSLLGNAKKLGRQITVGSKEIGAIDFQSHFSGISLPSDDITKYYSNRPFKMNKQGTINNEIHYLLNNIIDKNFQLNMGLRENYNNLYDFVYSELQILNSNSKNSKSNSILNDFRNKVKKIQTFFSLPPKNFMEEKQKALSFILYSTVRQKKKIGKRNIGRESYIKLFNLVGDHNSNNPILMFDAIEVLRFLTGGLL